MLMIHYAPVMTCGGKEKVLTSPVREASSQEPEGLFQLKIESPSLQRVG